VERINAEITKFMNEVLLEKPKTLDILNSWFRTWLSECYQNRPHSALGENTSPATAYNSDRKALRFVAPEVLTNAFLHSEDRKVDKSGCISFMGKKYEVGLTFIGRTVQVVYDPADITVLTIEYDGHTPWQVREMVIGERSGTRPTLPDHMQKEPADSSRLLRGAQTKQVERKEHVSPAVSYRTVRKEVNGDV
jgi:putative transposase